MGYSTNLGLNLLTTGGSAGTWGDVTNTNLGTLVEQAISGYVTQAVATGTDTTITIPNGATGVARNMYLELTGTGGASTNLIVPANKKLYFIYNNTASGQVTVKVAGQTGVSVPNGKKMSLVCNGTDVVEAINYSASIAGGSNTQVQYNSSGSLAGSANLTFDGTTLTANALTTTSAVTLSGGTANGVAYLNGSKVLTSGSALVFDGANLGIGTSSPAEKLSINGRMKFSSFSTSVDDFALWADNSNGLTLATATTWPMVFRTNNAEQMRLDSTGNLGLGVTPSAWYSTRKVLSVGNGTSYVGYIGSPGTEIWTNSYLDSAATARYIYSGYNATQFSSAAGQFLWNIAPSGTAGTAISFTQAMTLDASGNLLVGKTSTAFTERLGIRGTGSSSAPTNLSDFSGSLVLVESNKAGTGYGGVGYCDNGGGGAAIAFGRGTTYDTNISFYTNPSSTTSSGAMTERARIDSSGNLLVGTTSSGIGTGRAIIYNNGSSNAAIFGNVTSTAAGVAVSKFYHVAASGGTSATQIEFVNSGGTVVGTVTSTGSATAYNTSSDYRLKDNQQQLTGSGAFIDALQPKTWKWKIDGSSGVGFIAHEVQAISPGSVVGEKDAVDADGKPIYQAMEYGSAEFIANIVAELQSLRARLAALEAR